MTLIPHKYEENAAGETAIQPNAKQLFRRRMPCIWRVGLDVTILRQRKTWGFRSILKSGRRAGVYRSGAALASPS